MYVDSNAERAYVSAYEGFRKEEPYNEIPLNIVVERWFYYVERAKFTIIEGAYKSIDEINEAIKIKERGNLEHKVLEDYPKLFQFSCRSQDLIHIAKAIVNLYKKEKYLTENELINLNIIYEILNELITKKEII